MKKVLVIDLGGTTAKCAIIENDKIIYRFIIPTLHGEIIENIYSKCIEELDSINVKKEDLEFIGMTVCGLLDNEHGISIWSGNLKWQNYPVLKEMKRTFKTNNIFLLNDSKAAAYGEYIKGQNRKVRSMFLYTIGTGIGGGLILNEELYFGSNNGLASEPGHGGGYQDKFKCNCNKAGCIEGLSSATGIEKLLNEPKVKEYLLNQINIENNIIKIKDVTPLLIAKNPIVMKVFEEAILPLSKHISTIQHLLDLNKILIGGGPSKIGQPLIDIIDSQLKTMMFPQFYKTRNIEIANLGNDAGMWGIYFWSVKQIKKNSILLKKT